jgi:RHS repeat-associated protein
MDRRTRCAKIFAVRFISRIGKRCICLLTMLALLTSSAGFVPDAYAAVTGRASNSIQTSKSTGNSGGPAGSSSVQPSEAAASPRNEYVPENVYDGQVTATVPFDTEKALTGLYPKGVYSENLDYIDKVIEYPAITGTFQSADKQSEQGSIQMKHVIHMPRQFGKPDASIPELSSTAYENPAATRNTGSSANTSVFGNVYTPSGSQAASPGVITGLQEGVDENDLNLIDSGTAAGLNHDESNVSDSVYSSASAGNILPGESVASSVYSTVYSSVYSTVYSTRETDLSFPIQNRGGRFTAGFSRQAGSSLLRFSYQDASLTLNPLDSASSSGSVHKNSITYQEIYPDADLKYTVGSGHLKEELILKKYTGKTDFYFQLGIGNASYRITSDSTILFSDPASGAPLFYMPRPFAIDNAASGDIERLPEFGGIIEKDGARGLLPTFLKDSSHRRCDLSFEITAEGLLKVSVDADWLRNAVYPVVIDPSIYLFDAAFYRPSTAYNLEGFQVGSGVPRYETARFNQGITVEEGTTNLLTANQSNIETSLDPGYVANGAGATVTRSTAQAWEGSASVQVNCAAGGDAYNGANLWNGAQGTGWAVTAGQKYTASLYAKGATGGEPFLLALYASDLTQIAAVAGTLTTSWQRFTVSATIPTGKTAVFMLARRYNTTSAVTYYLDGIQLEQKPYATSWNPGGAARAAEILTIPTANVFAKGNWSVELTYKPTRITGSFQVLWYNYIVSTQEAYMLYVDPYNGGTLDLVVSSAASGTMQNYGIVSPFTLSAGNVYSIAATGNGSTLALYCNGQPAGSGSYLEPVGGLPPVMGIGCLSYLSGDLLYYGYQADGVIDDLRVSSRARTAAEVLADYQSDQPLPIDEHTTCKLSFDGSVTANAAGQTGAGAEPYWNYTGLDLGGGWKAAVNTWNRNLVVSKPLFQIPGRGITIGEGITYNSQGNKTWTFGNFTGVYENQDGSVTYTKGDGGSYTFTLNGGSYTAPPGVYLNLTKNGPGSFTIQDKHGNTYSYVNGKPYQFIDRNNNATTFTYDSSGRLHQVTDASGRPITYTYDLVGRINYVTDPEARSYQFGYQNSLASVTDPDGQTLTLGYDTNGHLSTFTDPLGRVTTFDIDAGGQLLSYDDARTSGPDAYTTTFAQSLQGGAVVTTVTDPGNRSTTYSHDSGTGNLTAKQDGVGNTWNYTWASNNLTQAQDAKGTTSYTYDGNGNILTKTVTVDSNPDNNIVETMTYDSFSQVLTKKDNSSYNDNQGRETDYAYDSHGNLLSVSDPNMKASSSYNYDQYGNTIQYNPDVLGYHNIIQNGSMEIPGTGGSPLSTWGQHGTATTVSRDSSWAPHGNLSLRIGNTTPYCYFSQEYIFDGFTVIGYDSGGYPIMAGDALTLKARVQLDNVTAGGGSGSEEPFGSGSASGLIVGYLFHSDDGYYGYEYVRCTGTGTITLTLPSVVPYVSAHPYYSIWRHVQVFVGLNNSSGTAWFDGVQLLHKGWGSQEHIVTAFNSVENSGFENGTAYWTGAGGTSSASSWEGSSSLLMTAAGTIYQDAPTHGGEALTFSGMANTSGVSGNGAYYRVDYYDAAGSLIPGASAQTVQITGTQDWTRLAVMANAPANAHHARIQCLLDGSGTAYFDDIKLIPISSMQYTYDKPGDYSNPGSYTGENFVKLSEDALGIQNAYAYDPNVGNMLAHADPLNHLTYFGYDNLNRLVQVTDPLGHDAYYQYDPVSNRIYTRDPRSASSSDNTYRTYYGPNSINLLDTLSDSLSRSATYAYDRSGNLTGISLPNGMSRSLTYDAANRLDRVTLSDGTYYDYTYDGAGEVIGVTDQGGAGYSWNYDGAHRVTGTTDPLGLALTYSWDKSGNVTGMGGGDYSSVGYAYDGGNNIYKAAVPGAWIYYGRDDSGRVYDVTYDPYYWANYEVEFATSHRIVDYLANGWCVGIQDQYFPYGSGYSYGYNNDGTINGQASWAGIDSFGYDSNGRLTSWSYTPSSYAGGSSRQESYSYDAAGNLLAKGSRSFTCNSANQITSSGFSYDNNGNLTGDGNFSYTYNALNQLVRVNRVSDGGLVASYAYNHDGTRRSKTVGGLTTSFSWDASGNLIRESGGPNGTYYYYYASGKLIAFRHDGQLFLVHDNLRGDVVGLSMTDANGNTYQVNHYNYDPWGSVLNDVEFVPLSFRYAGYYYDLETGLYYLKSRYYSPGLGRFLTRDDHKYIEDKNPQTLNLYQYAGNNPVSNTDPSGTDVGLDQNGNPLNPDRNAIMEWLSSLGIVAGTNTSANNLFKWALKKNGVDLNDKDLVRSIHEYLDQGKIGRDYTKAELLQEIHNYLVTMGSSECMFVIMIKPPYSEDMPDLVKMMFYPEKNII